MHASTESCSGLSRLLATVCVDRYCRIVGNGAGLLRVNNLSESRQIFFFELLPFLERRVHRHADSLQGRERFGRRRKISAIHKGDQRHQTIVRGDEAAPFGVSRI